jgi:membrane protein
MDRLAGGWSRNARGPAAVDPGMVDRKGHQARSPSEIPAPGWKDIARRSYKRTWDDNVGLVSAGVAFYGFFALLSLLGLIVLSYGFVADPHLVIRDVRALTTFLPGDIASLIGDQLMTAVHASEGRKGAALLLALAVGLYGGTNGAAATITALNIAYEEKEKRGLVVFYLTALGLTLCAVVLALVLLSATAAAAALGRLVPDASGATIIAGRVLTDIALVLIAAAVAATLYRFGPSREDARWKWITPGSIFAATSWLIMTLLFGLYVSNLTDYDATYGSLGAVVALLTWLYFSAYAFVFGAELNSEIEHQTAKDSTTGSPAPMGERGAWAADNVATDDTVQDRPEEKREGQKLTESAPRVAEEEG